MQEGGQAPPFRVHWPIERIGYRLAADLRRLAVLFLAVDLRAGLLRVDLRAVDLRAALFRVDLRAVDLRAVDLRAVDFLAGLLRVDLRAVDFRAVVLRAGAAFLVRLFAVDFLAGMGVHPLSMIRTPCASGVFALARSCPPTPRTARRGAGRS